MEITCSQCKGTGISLSTGESCHVCGGDGTIEAEGVHEISEAHVIAIFDIVTRVETKLDTLQDDITAIKAKVDNMPDNLVNVLQDIHEHVE